jgi:putative phosphoesterase
MVKVGAISDTHAKRLNELPKDALKILSDVDLIIHAGDYTHVSLLEELRSMGEFKGVFGNMDPPEVRKALPPLLKIEIGRFEIGVIHPPEGGPPFNIERRVRDKFSKPKVIIFGHTHMARKKMINDILFINPGSATGAFPAVHETMCILDVGNTINARIVQF